MARENARRFHFIKEIASGGFGSVYLAKVMHADGFSRLAAIKLLHQRWGENAEIAQRMRDEARLLGWLRHRNIVDVLDLTTIGGRVAVIMEYLEAVDFKCAVSHLAETDERMPPRAALEAVAFVGSALDAAYNRPPYEGEKPLRVIHRDIKPSNVMVDESGTVKVLDFGVARAEFDQRETTTSEIQFGSVDYMPPERLFFEPDNDRSDVYSLGATLYELLARDKLGKAKGRPEKHLQFLDERFADLRARCDLDGLSGEATIALVREMVDYDHEKRPSAAEVVQRCRALARGFEGEGLTEWAERVIPPLVKAAADAPREPNPLTDSVLTEDSTSFERHEDTFHDSDDQPRPEADTWVATTHTEDEVEVVDTQPPPPPEPPPAPRPEPVREMEPPEPPKRSMLLPLVGAGVVLLLLGGGGLFAAGALLGLGSAEAPAAPTAGAGAGAAPIAPVKGGLRFVSKAKDTAKVTATCDGKEASGEGEAAVDLKIAQRCAVKVMLKDRTRLVAEVAGPTEGTYTCFAGDSKECVR
ncbi:MAG: serine/threonine-protein kinase [Myxococcota bacterium]